MSRVELIQGASKPSVGSSSWASNGVVQVGCGLTWHIRVSQGVVQVGRGRSLNKNRVGCTIVAQNCDDIITGDHRNTGFSQTLGFQIFGEDIVRGIRA